MNLILRNFVLPSGCWVKPRRNPILGDAMETARTARRIMVTGMDDGIMDTTILAVVNVAGIKVYEWWRGLC